MRKNTKHNPFLGSLRAVAIGIGKRDNINIKFAGNNAKTDGRTIYLPATLPADNEEMELMMRGFLDHEVGHVKHTDFGIPAPSHRLIHTITNIVEDIRIEQLMGLEYPGCAVNLRESVDFMQSIGKISYTDQADAIGATLMAISYGARVKHLRNNLKKEAESYRRLAGKQRGQKALSVIDMAIKEAGSLTSTQAAQELAKKVYDLLKQISEEPPQPPPPQPEESEQQQDNKDKEGEGQGGKGESPEEEQSGKDAQENQDNAGSGSDEQDSEGQDDSPAGGEGSGDQNEKNDDDSGTGEGADGGEGDDSSDSNDSSDNGSGAGSQQGNDESNPSGEKPQPVPTSKQRQNIEQLLEASESDLEQTEKDLDVAAQAANEINQGTQNTGNVVPTDSSGNTGEVEEVKTGSCGDAVYIQNLAQKTVGLRGKLAGLFQSTKLKRDNPQLTGYKLDQRAVHRLAAMTPDTRIFQRRREKVNDNTAIAIVVDRSGSMRDEIGLATASAYSVVKATESMPGVKCAVAAFPYSHGKVFGLKDFSEKSNPKRFNIDATGGTPLDVALRWAGQKLWPRQENRKIVLVLTDGAPDDYHKTQKMVDLLLQCNIECYGIGIGCGTGPMVKQFFGENSQEIATIEDLAKAMFDTLANAMTRR